MYDRPYLDCPDCGEPLFLASGQDNGDWVWHEAGPTQCPCGAWCIVDIDDDRAVVSEVEEPEP